MNSDGDEFEVDGNSSADICGEPRVWGESEQRSASRGPTSLRPAGTAERQGARLGRDGVVVDFSFVRVEDKILDFHAAGGTVDREADRIDGWDGSNLTIGGGFWPFVLDPARASDNGNAAAVFTSNGFRHHDTPRNSAGPTWWEAQDSKMHNSCQNGGYSDEDVTF
jgi:hypothetical protein